MRVVSGLTELTAGSVISPDERNEVITGLRDAAAMEVYPESVTPAHKALYCLVRQSRRKSLVVLAAKGADPDFEGERQSPRLGNTPVELLVCPLNSFNASRLRNVFPFLVPRSFGLSKSFGCGDRLGLATPGHIQAVRRACGSTDPATVRLNLAQQSMRENSRTGRTPQSVIDDATWGVFQAGWRAGYGADADHLKTTEDIDRCVDAGYTFFTIDPGEYVDESADALPVGQLESAWTAKTRSSPPGSKLSDLFARLVARPLDLGDRKMQLTEEQVVRAAVKYGAVVHHTTRMYGHLEQKMGDLPFDLEMSVDETNSVTSPAEHIYIATELRRLGVKWVSLAPRYPGRFEKGVDYLGSSGAPLDSTLKTFEASFAEHVSIARAMGPYKLSLHSGSDKFAIYPTYARLAGDLVHVKTAGTSYLEALRALASLNPPLFREIFRFAAERYTTDRATYHVSADLSLLPDVRSLTDDQLSLLLDDFHARQILHVTFGSVLNDAQLRSGLFEALEEREDVYYALLEQHFEKHLAPFCRA